MASSASSPESSLPPVVMSTRHNQISIKIFKDSAPWVISRLQELRFEFYINNCGNTCGRAKHKPELYFNFLFFFGRQFCCIGVAGGYASAL